MESNNENLFYNLTQSSSAVQDLLLFNVLSSNQLSYKELEKAFIWNISKEIISYIYYMDNHVTNPVIQDLIAEVNRYRQNILDPSFDFFKQSPASVFYILSIENLSLIVRHGLLSHNQVYKQFKDSIYDISNQEVNRRRNRKEKIYRRNIHDYVPFYWNPRNPMLYSTQCRFGEDIIILGFELKKFFQFLFQRKQGEFLFSNMNVACDNVNFFPYLEELYYHYPDPKNYLEYPVYTIELNKFLDFSKIFQKFWIDNDRIKKIMMSEILVYENVPFELVTDIYVQTTEIKEEVLFIFEQEKIANIPRIFCGKDGYFF